MKVNIAIGLALVSLLLLCALATFYVQQAKGQQALVFPLNPAAKVYVETPIISSLPGQTVNVSVNVSTPLDLNLCGWQLRLQWDPSILNYTSSTSSWSGGTQKVNTTTGQLLAGYPYFSNVSSASPSKVLTVTFQSIAYGISSINVTSFALMGMSDNGNGWTNGTDPYNGIPEFTQYDRSPDVNNDGKVNVLDLIAVGPCLGSTVGDTNYNSACDVNNDSFVDFFDFTIVVSHLSEVGIGPWLTHTVYVFN